MRKTYKRFVLVLLMGVLASLGMTASQTDTGFAQTTTKPNILFILTDDMKASDLAYMPNTQNFLASQGVKFTKAWVTRSLCCPSRASTLRGQYTHNHNVWVNVEPSGGFQKFYNQGHESSTIATWLHAGGYETVLIGKYLNRYGNNTPTTHVPRGWDKWYAWEGMYGGNGTSYQINENGNVVTYQRSEIHDTDLHAQTAENFIRQTANNNTPFFMYLAPNAPHHPAYYAPRHASMFSNTALPKPSSFNEADVSDKPAWVRNKPRPSSTQISDMTQFYRNRLRALQSVDEMVKRLVDALSATGELSNTYIVFTSDNGIYLGEHRLESKAAAYNAAPRVPLLVRGPGVARGVTRPQMALNNDLAPTFASWAGVRPPNFVDGRSLRPLLRASPPAFWRSGFLVEHWRAENDDSYAATIPNYRAVRTARYLYVEYEPGARELYDLSNDPYERRSLPRTAGSELKSRLESRLDALRWCSADRCRSAEN